MRKRRTSLLTAMFVIAAVFASNVAARTDTSRTSSASLQLKIGALIAQTGTSGVYGPSWEKSVNMAASVVNAAAKQAGVDLQVSIDAADNRVRCGPRPFRPPKSWSRGTARACLVGTLVVCNGRTSAATSVAIPQGIPRVDRVRRPLLGRPPCTRRLDVRTVAADPLEASGLARVVAQRVKGAKGKLISVAGRNDVYGQGLTAAFSKAWKALGGKVQGPLLYDPTASNYDSEAQQIVSGSPKAYVIIDLPGTYGTVASALLRTGKWSTSNSFIAGGYPSPIPSGIPPATLNSVTGVSPGFPRSGKLVEGFNALWNKTSGTSQQQSSTRTCSTL